MVFTKHDAAQAPEQAVIDDKPLHVFDQTNGVLGTPVEAPAKDAPDHAARNGLAVGGVTNPGPGAVGF